jgi:hypothetical protein
VSDVGKCPEQHSHCPTEAMSDLSMVHIADSTLQKDTRTSLLCSMGMKNKIQFSAKQYPD